MTFRVLRALALLVSLALATTACDSGRKNPPDARVRIMNVAPSYTSLWFSREHVTVFNGPINVAFNGGAEPTTPYDEDTYDFYVFKQSGATDSADTDPIYTFQKQLVAGTVYTVVLLEAGGAIEHALLESPPVSASATASDTQVQLLHAAESVPAVDIYLEPPGANVAAATPWGSVAFRANVAARNIPAGDYELTITSAGNPTAVLLTSEVFTLAAAQSTTFVLSPDSGNGLGQLAVPAAQAGGTAVFVDRNSPAQVRVINGATDEMPRDVAFNGQFTPPLFSAVPFAAPTARAPLAAGTEIPVNVTPVGNPGVLELDQKVNSSATDPYTLLISGDAGVLVHSFVNDDLRRIAGVAKLRFYNAAPQFPALELLLVPPGVDPATFLSTIVLPPGTISASFDVNPGTYDLYVRQALTAIVAGPLAVTLLERSIYGVLATNGDSSATADVTLIDDFQ